jgi:hypothetical protein
MPALPRRAAPVRLHRRRVFGAFALAAAAALSACFTGERPHLAQGATNTGDAAVDAVLSRLDAADDARFTADYRVLTKFGDISSSATVAQAGPARRAVTIRRTRFVVDGADTATCDLDAGSCSDTIDAQRVSDLQLTPDFYGSSPAARLRRDAGLRAGRTTPSSETIAGQRATCVEVPVNGGASTYCALDSGALARLDAADLMIELSRYSPKVTEAQLRRPD